MEKKIAFEMEGHIPLLTKQQFKVLNYLNVYHYAEDKLSSIAKNLGIARSTVYGAVEMLQSWGLVYKVVRLEGKPVIYTQISMKGIGYLKVRY